MMMLDLTTDIKEGRFLSRPSFSYSKIFGRRIFVKLNEAIIMGNLQYTIEKDKNVLIIFVNFNFNTRNKSNPDNTKNLILKEYKLSEDIDMILFMKKVRQEIIDEPQVEGFKWSFVAESLL